MNLSYDIYHVDLIDMNLFLNDVGKVFIEITPRLKISIVICYIPGVINLIISNCHTCSQRHIYLCSSF